MYMRLAIGYSHLGTSRDKDIWILVRKIIILSAGLVFLTYCSRGGAPTYGVSGTVTSSGAGLPGVIMTLSGEGTGSMLTDANGKYTFTNLAVGNYTITPAKFGYSFEPTSSVQNVDGADISDVNFTGSVATTNTGLCNDFSVTLVTTDSLGSASTFSIGTPITLQMQVTNLSDQDQTLTEEFNCGGLPFTIFDVSGNSVFINPDPRLACPTMLSPYHFAPGQTQTLTAVWKQTTNNGTQFPTGKYTVTATLSTVDCTGVSGNSLSQSTDFQIQ